MGSSAKTGKFFIGGSQEHFFASKTKVPFGIGHPPTYTSNQSICVQEGSGVPNLQTELNYLDLFKSYRNSPDLGLHGPRGWGRWVGGVQGDQL